MLLMMVVAGLIAPINGFGIKSFELLFMAILSLAIYPFTFIGLKINRFEGLFLLLMYGGYLYKIWP
jgi:Ca2+/Na+ antiporter